MKKILFTLLAFPLISFSCDEGIVRNNTKQISENSILSNGMTQEEFKKTIAHFENYFAPIIERDYRSELVVYHSWTSNTINAYADKKTRKYEITVFGGLARYKSMTADSLTLTLCHEIGHFFGGYPKKSTNVWSSAEGQADYYSTAKCLRRIWATDNNIEIMSRINVPELVKLECAQSYSHLNEQALCQRTSLAGKAMAELFQFLENDYREPQFETPDQEISRAMQYMHPFAQCRLDTYFQGSICPVQESIEFDDKEELTGSCHQKLGDTRGLRPACWFYTRTR